MRHYNLYTHEGYLSWQELVTLALARRRQRLPLSAADPELDRAESPAPPNCGVSHDESLTPERL